MCLQMAVAGGLTVCFTRAAADAANPPKPHEKLKRTPIQRAAESRVGWKLCCEGSNRGARSTGLGASVFGFGESIRSVGGLVKEMTVVLLDAIRADSMTEVNLTAGGDIAFHLFPVALVVSHPFAMGTNWQETAEGLHVREGLSQVGGNPSEFEEHDDLAGERLQRTLAVLWQIVRFAVHDTQGAQVEPIGRGQGYTRIETDTRVFHHQRVVGEALIQTCILHDERL